MTERFMYHDHPSPDAELADLLRRLDSWREGEAAGPLIRWAAAVIRGTPRSETHATTDPTAPVGYQCGDAGCEWHGVAAMGAPLDAEDMGTGWSQGPTTFGQQIAAKSGLPKDIAERVRLLEDEPPDPGKPEGGPYPERPDIDVKRLALAIVVWALQDATYSRPWVKRIKRHALADAHKIAAAYAAQLAP